MSAIPPPTPGVPLDALLRRADLGLRLIVGPGPGSADVLVHGAHASEMADPYPYLLGGELLLTAGVHAGEAVRRDGGAEHFEAYAARVAAGGAAALGFGVAPVYDTVPRELVVACERRGLPLLEVERHTTFSGVARAVWELMAQARNAELHRVTEAQRALASAAARPDPVPAVLRQLSRHTGSFAVLVGADGARRQVAGARPPGPVEDALARLTEVVGAGADRPSPAPASASDTVDGTHLSAYALGPGGALGLAAAERRAGDHTLAGAGVVLLSLLTGEERPEGDARRTAALVDLLLGADRGAAAAKLLGTAGRWKVVHARARLADRTGQGDRRCLTAHNPVVRLLS
ncbi:PucR family transcriptional regulator ligand-binding domain-containing protein, partial [Streptomyces beihaiensis]